MKLTSPRFIKILKKENIENLRKFNIRHIEQLGSILQKPTGQVAFQLLGLTNVVYEDLFLEIHNYYKTLSSSRFELSEDKKTVIPKSDFKENNYPLGLSSNSKLLGFNDIIPPPSYLDEILNYKRKDNEPKRHLILQQNILPTVKDQRNRGTCVAFATTAAMEAYLLKHKNGNTRNIKFSEQYLFFRAKQIDPNQDVEGTTFQYAIEALSDHGVCLESDLPYNGNTDWGQGYIFDKEVAQLEIIMEKASRLKLEDHEIIYNPNNIGKLKSILLNHNLAIIIGVKVFRDAWYNEYTQRRGEVALPITKDETGGAKLLDNEVGGHAITIYGYEDDHKNSALKRPGGGGFIFRNSWSDNWAINSETKRGYGLIPYEYIARYATSAFVIKKINY